MKATNQFSLKGSMARNVAFFLFLILIYTSCEKNETPKITFHGNVINTTGRPVSNAIVTIDNQVSGNTNLNGDFSVTLPEGDHVFTFSAPGYNSTPVSYNINSSSSQDEFTILGSANISGIIIDSQTGRGLANASIFFSDDADPTHTETAELEATSMSNGSFSIVNGPIGNFYCIVIVTNYFPRISERTTINSGNNSIPQQTIVSRPAQGSLRLVLSWGQSPLDLDSHLTGPNASGARFHVYWNNKTPEPAVKLDVDDVSSFGPETITLTNIRNGLYRYSVQNFSNRTSSGGSGIASSPAVVEVYNYDGLLKKYTAPAFSGSGNTWRVFEMNVNGTAINVNSVNSYVQVTSPSDVTSFKSEINASENDISKL